MQFGCQSCKASLSIADEKVRGKRLVVRCRRCGSRIQIADPAFSAGPVLLDRPAVRAALAVPPRLSVTVSVTV